MALLWGLGVRAAWRRRAGDELRLHGLLAIVWLLAVVSVSRIFGPFFEYTIRWVWFVAALTVAGSVWSLTRAWEAPRAAVARRVAAGAAAAVVVVAAVQFGARAEPTGFDDGRLVQAVLPATIPRLDPEARHLVQWWDVALLGAAGFGTILELERQGFDVVALPQYAAAVLPHRTAPEEAVDAVLYVVTGENPIATARATAGVEELAYADLRSDDERARSTAMRAEIEAALVDLGRSDLLVLLDEFYGQLQLLFLEPPLPQELEDLVYDYIDLGQPVAVFRAAPGTPVLPLGGGPR
jgi:hypothetical protein